MDSSQAKQFAEQLLQKGTVANWNLHSFLGFGKSAVILKAEKNGQEAAIKVFHRELIDRFGLPAQMIRIERERMLIGTTHPSLVQIIDGGMCNDVNLPYVVMELVPGEILSNVLEVIPRTSIESMIEQLARAVKHLEDLGLVHRDIKPDNIMVLDVDRPLIKLLDFGVIRPIGDSSATDQPGHAPFIGTHQYSPPELAHCREEDSIDGWRAITFYQIGAVLHDLIMRKRLFATEQQTIADLVNAIDETDPDVHAHEVPLELCALAKRCLLKKPNERTRLVEWSDFLFSEKPQAPDVQQRKELLFKRQQTFPARCVVNPLEKIERVRLDNHRL